MWDTRANENKVTGVKGLHGITYDPVTGSFGDETELIGLVIVPGALINMILENPDKEAFIRIPLDLFEKFLHDGIIMCKNKRIVKIAS